VVFILFLKGIFMKTIVLIALMGTSLVGNAYARNHNEDANRTIQCKNVATNEVLLRFPASAGAGTFSNEEMSLEVITVSDDIRSIILTDEASGDVAQAIRQEELLTLKLTTDEAPKSPAISKTFTRNGAALATVSHPSGDSAVVEARSRRGEGMMLLELVTDEGPVRAVRCDKF
jgi:hypothetical protein